jgi:hypothetical protein
MSVQCLQLLIMILLVCINHFPVYLVFGYFLHPGLFIKSVYFEIVPHSLNLLFPTNYLKVIKQKHAFFLILQEFLTIVKLQIVELANFSTIKHVMLGTRIPRTRHFTQAKENY